MEKCRKHKDGRKVVLKIDWLVNLRQSVVICKWNYHELETSQVTTGFKGVRKREQGEKSETKNNAAYGASWSKREQEQ